MADEIILTFDPTPGTWMYEWDNDRAEDAKLAANIGFVYRHLPTTQDAAVIFPETGQSTSRQHRVEPHQPWISGKLILELYRRSVPDLELLPISIRGQWPGERTRYPNG
ncbi:MAG: hypothetical protein U5K54_00005 [Cytophagales bacterium]|nr:hypothetical protein [Cytophagales bacterium]